MFTQNILFCLLCLPVVGALGILFFPKKAVRQMKLFALNVSLCNFLLSLNLWIFFDNSSAKFQFVQQMDWFSFFNMNFYIGIDGISLFFILLTTFLVPICLLISWQSVNHLVKEFLVAFLFLETFMIAVFCMLDLLLFYVFFESVLIPMFLIIGVWGSRERKIRAAYQFFLYTLIGSLFMLLAILLIYFQVGTTDLQVLSTVEFSERRQFFLWAAFFLSFAVKVPMIPFIFGYLKLMLRRQLQDP
jgi:NADH:ubiquinone oxidoreductase subunit 4 (subunit M)